LGALELRTELQSTQMSKTKNGGLDQYGAKPFEQQPFGTAGIEGVNTVFIPCYLQADCLEIWLSLVLCTRIE